MSRLLSDFVVFCVVMVALAFGLAFISGALDFVVAYLKRMFRS